MTPTLPYNAETNAPCPFDAILCKNSTGNLVMDTGYIESNKDLGINGGPRFNLRQERQCAPLVTDGYKRNVTEEERSIVRYYYQTAQNTTGLQPDFDTPDGFTWEVPAYNISQAGRLGSSAQQSLSGYHYG